MQWLRDLLFEYRACRVSEQQVVTAVSRHTAAARVEQLEDALRNLLNTSTKMEDFVDGGDLWPGEFALHRQSLANAAAVLDQKTREAI
jgi:hypothetical protein